MRVVPAVLQSSILAAVLLFPVAGLLATAGLDGSLGVRISAVVVLAGLLYAVVVWLVGRRRDAEELRQVSPAPPEAELEPLGRMAARGAYALVAFAGAGAFMAEAFDLLVVVLVIATGVGLAAARAALHYSRWERGHPGRLVRDPEGVLRIF